MDKTFHSLKKKKVDLIFWKSKEVNPNEAAFCYTAHEF